MEKFYREIIHLQVQEGKIEDMKNILGKIVPLTAKKEGCHYCHAYIDLENKDMVVIDQEWDCEEQLHSTLVDEEIKILDVQMKSMICGGSRNVLELIV